MPPIVHEVLSTPGEPLDTAARSFMEPRFGHDFSKVRVHTAGAAAASAAAVQARAYTVGQHIVLGAGSPAPGSLSGRLLLAHELAHVLCGFPEKEGMEGLCHRFAGAFLLPRGALERAFGGGPRRRVTLAGLAEIKTTFGISLQAVMYRAKSLGLVSDRQFRAFRETVNARGWTVTEPVAYAGVERAARFRRLVHNAVAADILDLERAAELAGVPAAELKVEMGDIF